ncbi:MAG TPA: sigma-70 family RNA polymerase sigma factor [Gemmataceae bacterium]|jgi:RNA polymerase sigma-70 factor (ECF subfamily)
MPVIRDGDTDRLLAAAANGDLAARDHLLACHRDRLRRAVARRLDPRLAARLDPSDVVQEALADADRKLSAYLRDRPLPFYPWLRRLAFERLVRLHRRHVRAGKRSVTREAPADDRDATVAADGPASAVVRAELHDRVRAALDRLPVADRAVLVLRHFEHRSVRETADRLGASEGAVKVRHLRALRRLSDLLTADEGPTA